MDLVDMGNIKRRCRRFLHMKYLFFLALLSCSTTITEPEVIKAVVVQETATDSIDKEAKKIQRVTKVPAVKNSAKIILVENDKLKGNIDVLAGLDKALADKDAEIKELNEQINSRIKAFIFILQAIGVLAISIGLFLCFHIGKQYFIAVIGGISLLMSGMIVNVILQYEKAIVISILVVGAVIIFRSYYTQHKKIKDKEVDVDDALKAVKASVELVDELKPHIDKEVVDGLLGHGGSVKNDAVTKDIINRYKK
jgi:hypothetical protein